MITSMALALLGIFLVVCCAAPLLAGMRDLDDRDPRGSWRVRGR